MFEIAADVFVQVRRGSSRVPDKALLTLADRTCLDHVLVRARDAREARHVVVCTSDAPEDAVLAESAAAAGARFFQGALDNVIDRFLRCADELGTQVIVRVAGDSPLVDPGCIDGAIRRLLDEDLDYVHTKSLPVGTYVEAFRTDALRRAERAAVDASRSEDLTFYVGREEINRVGEYLPPEPLRRGDLVLALNRPEDVPVLRAVLEHAGRDGDYVTLGRAIAWLDEHPDVAASNRDYVPVPTRGNTELDPSRLGAGA
ncbi:MAG TPA: NTP transferase domain-containing protein [Gaiellaceae bacterium]|nr:NTP transferase domain-containing protein [Gaiellaceae bacterium]